LATLSALVGPGAYHIDAAANDVSAAAADFEL